MGLYDYLYEFDLTYDKLRTRLYNLSQFLPIDYKKMGKELDSIYDETEYDLFKIEQNQKQFESNCYALWESVADNQSNQDRYDEFCNKIDSRYNAIHKKFGINAYIRVLWYESDYDPEEISEEILDLGKRLNIKQYCVFKDFKDNTVIVALHTIPQLAEAREIDDEK